jgi:hypothetical protein
MDQVSVLLPANLAAWLRDEAKRIERPVSFVVRKLIHREQLNRSVDATESQSPTALTATSFAPVTAPANKSLFLPDFTVRRKIPANTGHVWCAAVSPYRKTDDEGPHFGS